MLLKLIIVQVTKLVNKEENKFTEQQQQQQEQKHKRIWSM